MNLYLCACCDRPVPNGDEVWSHNGVFVYCSLACQLQDEDDPEDNMPPGLDGQGEG